MELTTRLIQAYRQTPWRLQVKWSAYFLIGLCIAVLFGGIYLSISAQAAAAGLSIQDLTETRNGLQRSIADLKMQKAMHISQAELEKRSTNLGFIPVDPTQAIYINVPGYIRRDSQFMAPPAAPFQQEQPLIKPAYTQSLWEWALDRLLADPGDNLK